MQQRSNTPAGGRPDWGAFLPRDLQLRPATERDRAARLAFFADMRDPERAGINWSDSMWSAFVADQFRLREIHYARVFGQAAVLMLMSKERTGGRLRTIGTVTVIVSRQSDDAHVARLITIEIGSLSRRQGVGSRVIEALAAAARAFGCVRLELSVAATNQGAQRLYQRLGFQPLDDLLCRAAPQSGQTEEAEAYLELGLPLT